MSPPTAQTSPNRSKHLLITLALGVGLLSNTAMASDCAQNKPRAYLPGAQPPRGVLIPGDDAKKQETKLRLPKSRSGSWSISYRLRTGTTVSQWHAVVEPDANDEYWAPLDIPESALPQLRSRWSDLTIRVAESDALKETASDWVAAQLFVKREGRRVRVTDEYGARNDPAFFQVDEMPGFAAHLKKLNAVVRVVENAGDDQLKIPSDELNKEAK